MRRFWADSSLLRGDHFLLKDSLYHHICRVSRLKKDSKFQILTGGSKKYTVQLVLKGKSEATAKILETYHVPQLEKPHIHIALSLSRFQTMDSILEKAVELGVREFHPFISEFSYFKNPSQISRSKWDRWERIQEKACAISNRAEPLILNPVSYLEDFKFSKGDLGLMAFEGEESTPLFSELMKKQKRSSVSRVYLFVGSEGGFSFEEANQFQENGGKVFSLGERILRVETACLLSLSLLKYFYHKL